MLKWMEGNGTNLGLIAAGTLLICWNHGLVDDKIATTIAAAITSWTGVRVRHAYSKANPKAAPSAAKLKQ